MQRILWSCTRLATGPPPGTLASLGLKTRTKTPPPAGAEGGVSFTPVPVSRRGRSGHQTGVTFSAAGPFWPSTTSNSTVAPSESDLKPLP
jgi:hypothetical protein